MHQGRIIRARPGPERPAGTPENRSAEICEWASETGGLAARSPQKGVTMTDMMDRTLTRASLIRGGAAAGVGLGGGWPHGVAPSFASGATQGDVDILIAAEIAEALAVTTYSNIIFRAPFFTRLADDDQGYPEGGTPGGDVALPAGEVGDRKGLAVHLVLLSAPHVPQRPASP
jgi:hypothetical protein